MEYTKAARSDAEQVFQIVQSSIEASYHKYYPQAVVEFFKELHGRENILKDILKGNVGVLTDGGTVVGTGSRAENHISRVYVAPEFWGRGYGGCIMRQLENEIFTEYEKCEIEASSAGYFFYEKRGYRTVRHEEFAVGGAVLLYEIMEKKKPGCLPIVEKIRARPGMWLGCKSITALWHFLHGYEFARLERGERFADELFPLDFGWFGEYTAAFSDMGLCAGWRNHILDICGGGDEERALEKFFELFDEFGKIRPKKMFKAVLSAENIAFNVEMRRCCKVCGADHSERRPIFDKPLAAYIIELSIPAFMLVAETESGLCASRSFYPSFEKASGKDAVPHGAEAYFGEIARWEEISELPRFGKKNELI